MGYSCRKCPWFVAKSAGEKKRHRDSHKGTQAISCEELVGEGGQGLAADGHPGQGEGHEAAGGPSEQVS